MDAPLFMLHFFFATQSLYSTVRNATDLAHMPLIIPSPTNVDGRDEDQPLPPPVETPNSLFSAGLPPVLSNLVKRIEEGEFIEI